MTSVTNKNCTKDKQKLTPLPIKRPLLAIGHGTKDIEGRQTFLDFAKAYHELDPSRPVVSCFLELTTPTIAEGIEYCLEKGYTELSVIPILLFAARHNKFDVTNSLDSIKQKYPQLKLHYGRHFGITPGILDLWRDRLVKLDLPANNPQNISRQDTILLFVGRGSSDPDANSDVCKMARILWEGSGYQTVETCFIGITHPRLEEGFRRARFYQPKRIIVLPYFLFTGVLVKKIFAIAAAEQEKYPHIAIDTLPEMGIQSQLLQVLRTREIEIQSGQVQMNCEICKFRLAAVSDDNTYHHHHHHEDHYTPDPYQNLEQYHGRIWQTP